MKKKILILFSVIFLLPIYNVSAETSTNIELTVRKVYTQIFTLDQSIPQEVIDMYTSADWIYNSELNQLERQVSYPDEEIKINDEKIISEDDGEVTVSVEENSIVEIVTESLSNDNKIVKEVIADEPNKEVTIYENISINEVLESMEDQELEMQSLNEETTEEGNVQVGGLVDGELPYQGDYVHCNRFNGYKGDGRYYSKTKHPVKAATNFFQSDCDVALARSTKCLADYGSNPYCSTKDTTTAGKCSPEIVDHSRKYHKHTGWFSPSK